KAPNDTEALTKRGYTYSLMGQYEKAIPDYQAALKVNPQDNDTFSRLQWTQSQLAAKNAPHPSTTTAATTTTASTATPEKPSLLSQIKPMYIVIGIVVLILIAVIVRLLTRGKAEETSHIVR